MEWCSYEYIHGNISLDFRAYIERLNRLNFPIGKISIDSEGKIGWIYYPENVGKHLKNKELFWNGT